MKHAVVIALALAGGCRDEGPTDVPVGACDGRVRTFEDDGGAHVNIGTDVEWSSNPPTTGPHYQNWARWNREYLDLDRRYWLHNVEHGGIVLLYNCPGGCPDVLDEFRARMRARAVDEACSDPIYNRMIIAADPLLDADVKIAAVSWNTLYTDSCIDPYLEKFVNQRYNHAPEDFCVEGIELGGTFVTRE